MDSESVQQRQRPIYWGESIIGYIVSDEQNSTKNGNGRKSRKPNKKKQSTNNGNQRLKESSEAQITNLREPDNCEQRTDRGPESESENQFTEMEVGGEIRNRSVHVQSRPRIVSRISDILRQKRQSNLFNRGREQHDRNYSHHNFEVPVEESGCDIFDPSRNADICNICGSNDSAAKFQSFVHLNEMGLESTPFACQTCHGRFAPNEISRHERNCFLTFNEVFFLFGNAVPGTEAKFNQRFRMLVCGNCAQLMKTM